MPTAIRPLTIWSLIRRSLRYFWRTHASVGLGIAAATAVIVGALVVGDSVRGSLRGLVVDRLANIECLLQARTFFDPVLLDKVSLESISGEVSPAPGRTPGQPEVALAPLILLPGTTVESSRGENLLRASQVQVLAIDDIFLKHLAADQAALFPDSLPEDCVVLNTTLARELNVEVGDELTLRLRETSGIPADNPLGSRDATSISLPRQKLVAVLPDEGIGGIGFVSGQAVPRNVFASLATVQDILDSDDRINAAVAFTAHPTSSVNDFGPTLCAALNQQLRPKLEDYGLSLKRHRRVFPDPEIDLPTGDEATVEDNVGAAAETVFDYYQLSSNELIIDQAMDTAIVDGMKQRPPTRLITYLANSIAKVKGTFVPTEPAPVFRPIKSSLRTVQEQALSVSMQHLDTEDGEPAKELLSREVPYSIVVGVDGELEREVRAFSTVSIADPYISYCWINSWLAEQIDAQPGDWLQLRYFEPETVDGNEVENWAQLYIAGVLPVTEPERAFQRNRPAQYSQRPTLFNDPNLTPSVPGVTDQDSISNWDLPFKLALEDLILPVDDTYWNNHRLTPKIFMPYRRASSKRFFGSRFGDTTALRWHAADVADEAELRGEVEQSLLSARNQIGLFFSPIRHAQLRAASGTTPFDMLFLSLSFFVIVAALLLVALLFKLGLQQRTSQLGIFLAQGFDGARVRKIMLRELAVVAGAGAAVGILLGLGYARLMIAGLETWWLGAISSPFLKFTFAWQSLLWGALAGMLASLATIYLSLRTMSRVRPLALLRGDDGSQSHSGRNINRMWLAIAGFVALAAGGLIVAGMGQAGMARAGSFFGSGMLLLAAGLILLRQWLGAGSLMTRKTQHANLMQLAWRAIGRNPTRSSLSLGLLAVASFLIASMGVFQVRPSERGYGGFDLLAETSQPIYRNLNSTRVRAELIGDEAEKLRETTIVPMRARRGEDASCNNLFQVSQPTVLGLSTDLQAMYDFSPSAVGFDWVAAVNGERPWAALNEAASGAMEDPIPVILDQNTAAWSLKQGASLGAVVELDFEGQQLYFRTVGLLGNSVLQGKLLIGEENFERIFPKISGYSYFLVRSGSPPTPQTMQSVAETLEKGWGDVGMDVTSSVTVLERLLGVQNTYISAFQSLGALGLLLGTFGLVAVQLRSVVERRRELALMQAVGFSSSRIARLLTFETALLLGGGLLIGVLCATLTLVPYVIETGPHLSLFNPLLMLLVVLLAGFLAASLAVRAAMRQSVLSGLRAE